MVVDLSPKPSLGQPAERPLRPRGEITEIRIRGKTIKVPSVLVMGCRVISVGKGLRIAKLLDEDLVEQAAVSDLNSFVSELRQKKFADIFAFAQKLDDVTPSYRHVMEWDNAAVIPITSYEDWWEKRLPQESRKNVRRASKRGVVVRPVHFDDAFVKGIQQIYDETPVRQGRPFWHYKKSFDAVKFENATYLDRSEFIGAYKNDELIGFIKFIYVDRVARLIQIISKNAHQDCRPMNALLAEAVRVCVEKNLSFLVYGKYVYGDNQASPLTEFKRRNGFEELKYPRYFVPLTQRGKVAIALRLHRGVRGFLPNTAVRILLNLRSTFYRSMTVRKGGVERPSGSSENTY